MWQDLEKYLTAVLDIGLHLEQVYVSDISMSNNQPLSTLKRGLDISIADKLDSQPNSVI